MMTATQTDTPKTDTWTDVNIDNLINSLKEPKKRELANMLGNISDAEVAKIIKQELGIPEEATKASLCILGVVPLALYSRNGDGLDKYITMKPLTIEQYKQMIRLSN